MGGDDNAIYVGSGLAGTPQTRSAADRRVTNNFSDAELGSPPQDMEDAGGKFVICSGLELVLGVLRGGLAFRHFQYAWLELQRKADAGAPEPQLLIGNQWP
jgi:hypothetical protein